MNRLKTGEAWITLLLSLVFLLGASALAADEGLIACWNLDEGSGTTAHDSSGYGNDATIEGAEWVPVGNGFGLEFLNDEKATWIPDTFDDPIDTVFSVTARVYWYGDLGDYPISYVFDGRNGPGSAGFLLGLDHDGLVTFIVYNSGDDQWFSSQTAVSTGEWTEITGVFSFSQDNEFARIYIDGKLDYEGVPTEPYYHTDRLATIGNNYWVERAPFEGVVDELRIYNTAIPEPSTLASLAIVGVALLAMRRRHQPRL
jgi:hypothetical protein